MQLFSGLIFSINVLFIHLNSIPKVLHLFAIKMFYMYIFIKSGIIYLLRVLQVSAYATACVERIDRNEKFH